MKKVTALLLLVLALLVSCDKVTETGNPLPGTNPPEQTGSPAGDDHGGDRPASPAVQSMQWYVNDAFSVSIGYPAGWSMKEEGEAEVEFTSPEALPTKANATFKHAGSTTLIGLANQYPCEGARTELVGDSGEADGYFCDQSAPGLRGGDLRDYYFMRGDTFVRIAFELFPTAEGLDGLNTIIGNVTAVQ